jgi:hypothetical protein
MRSYEVTEWGERKITATDVAPCGAATLSIDFKQKTAQIVSVPHGDSPMCPRANAGVGKTDVWMLTDGVEVAKRVYDKRLRDSVALVYGPARDLINRQMFGLESFCDRTGIARQQSGKGFPSDDHCVDRITHRPTPNSRREAPKRCTWA